MDEAPTPIKRVCKEDKRITTDEEEDFIAFGTSSRETMAVGQDCEGDGDVDMGSESSDGSEKRPVEVPHTLECEEELEDLEITMEETVEKAAFPVASKQ